MKKHILKCIALLLAVVLAIPILPTGKPMVASAATKPSLSLSSKTLVGVGAAFTVTVKNLGTSKVKSAVWTSSNKKVATVESDRGYVTAQGKGTANIKVKITYTNKKVTTLTCKVTVKIPATGIEFTNAQDTENNNNRHVIVVGESYDFDSVKIPSNSTDLITYTIDNTSFATVDKKGIVVGKKPGFVRLKATASMTKAGAATSKVDDIINIEIVDKTARVSSVVLTDNTTLTVTFDRAIDASTVIGTDNKLLGNVSITAKSNEKGVIANGVGTLKATLSTDNKILTITSSKIFNGFYGIHLSSNIKSTDEVALLDYYKEIEYYDTVAPAYKDYTVDDTGLKVTINFTEPIDFTNLKIESAKTVTTGHTALPITLSILGDKANYTKSEDSKSLTIDLSSIPTYDQNKAFSVVISGIKDMAGNYPTNLFVTAYLQTDTSPKAQAKLTTLERTGYNTITGTFTRAIKTPGMIILSNGESIAGVVDATDSKKVNYTLSASAALLTGTQKVSAGYWDSYNVSTSDTSANTTTDRYINFAIDKSIPVLTKHELTIDTTNGVDTYILTMTYNKNVTLLSPSGTFISKLITTSNDIYGNRLIGYTAVAQGSIVTVVLNKDQFTESGSYSITIPQGFVQDEYLNLNVESTIQVVKGGTSSTALPAPKGVSQSPEDASIVYVTFANKLDEASAQNVSNYLIVGAAVIKAELIDNTASGATVKLTMASGTISINTLYPIIITGVMGYHNSYTAMERYEAMVFLNENAGPTLTKTPTYTYPNTITLTFSETLKGTASFQVLHENANIAASSIVSGNTIIITLTTVPTKTSVMQISPTQLNNIQDAAGNLASINTMNIYATY